MNQNNKELLDLNVLYAEDEEIIREPFVEMLKRRVKSVTAVKNGKEALEQYYTNHFDLIITDIRMPVMTGLELAAEIRRTNMYIPIIVTTAYEFRDFLIRAIEVGINKYLVKPIQKESVTLALEEMMTLVQFQRKLSDHHELIDLIIRGENKIIIWAAIQNANTINSDFLEYFKIPSRDDFYSQYASPTDFFQKNSDKSFRYNTTKDIRWIDSFMKLNGVERNTIINMSGYTTDTDFHLTMKVFSNNTKVAFILKPYHDQPQIQGHG